jgi:hypothetical protein
LLSRWYEDSHATAAIETPVMTAPNDVILREDVRSVVTEIGAPTRCIFRFDPGWNRPTVELAAALALHTWATEGQLIENGFELIFLRPGENAGTARPTPESKKIRRRNAKLRKAMQTPLGRDIDRGKDRTGTVHTISRPEVRDPWRR